MADLVCRHCGRSIAVPASTCPWCGKTIMVICANCKAYTDDEQPRCEHCGALLEADRMERVALYAHHPEIAQLADDRENAHLVASAVLINHVGDFFYDDGRDKRTVLVTLLGSGRERQAVAGGVLFVAYAYLCQNGYCALPVQGAQAARTYLGLRQLRAWDGQRCIEDAVCNQAARAFTTREASEKVLRDLMGFRITRVDSGSVVRGPKTQDAPERSAPAALDQVARLTELPDHDVKDACRVTYQLLLAFIEADQNRARLLARETLRLLREFEQYG